MPTTPEPVAEPKGPLSWFFRSRTTGRNTLAQLPNWPLGLWLVASVVTRVAKPQGQVRAVLVVVAALALAVWAGGEILRGESPFRRILGLAVLGWLVFSWWRG